MRYTLACLSVLLLNVAFSQEREKETQVDPREILGGYNYRVSLPDTGFWYNHNRPYTLEEKDEKLLFMCYWTPNQVDSEEAINLMEEFAGRHAEVELLTLYMTEDSAEMMQENVFDRIHQYGMDHSVYRPFNEKGLEELNFQNYPDAAAVLGGGTVYFKGNGITGMKQLIERLDTLLPNRDVVKDNFSTSSPRYGAYNGTLPFDIINYPTGIESSPGDDVLFVCDSGNDRIFKLNTEGEILMTIGSGIEGFRDDVIHKARFNNPKGMAYDATNDVLYVADTYNHAIRRVSFKDNIVTTILGTGEQGLQATGEVHGSTGRISYPTDVEVRGGSLFISVSGYNQIWEQDILTKKAKPIAGNGNRECVDGKALECSINAPRSLAFSDDGTLFFIDSETGDIRSRMVSGEVMTVFKNAGEVIHDPRGLCYNNGLLYITDGYGNGLHSLQDTVLTTHTKNLKQGWESGKFGSAQFNEPTGIAFLGNVAYVTDCANGLIRQVNFKKKKVSPFEITNLENLPRYEPAITGGKKVLLPEININDGENIIDFEIIVENGYQIVDGGFHYAYLEDKNEFNELVQDDVEGKELRIIAEGDEYNVLARFEFQVTLTKTDKPGSLYYESLQVIQPLNSMPTAESRHNIVLDITKDYPN